MAKKKDNKQTISVDGTEYDVEKLTENAKAQINNVNFVDTQLQQLTNELAVADTARIGYENALKVEVKKTNNGKENSA